MACLAAVAIAAGSLNGVSDGTLPLLHLTERYGLEPSAVPSLRGKTALVTGASSGLGLGVARALAKAGAKLIITCRDVAKCDATVKLLKEHAAGGSSGASADGGDGGDGGGGGGGGGEPSSASASASASAPASASASSAAPIVCVPMELLNLRLVDASSRVVIRTLSELAAEASPAPSRFSFASAATAPLDLLVLNAGIMSPPTLELSTDGLEAQFAVNHLAHFHLTTQLLPHLQASVDPRVVSVSSIAHWGAPKEPLLSRDALTNRSTYDPMAWYGWSKLCNILFARELSRRLPAVPAYAIHPGGVQGKLLRYAPLHSSIVSALESLLYWRIDTAALTVLAPLVRPAESRLAPGAYLVPIARERQASAQAADEDLAKRVWEWSEALIAESLGRKA